MAQGKNTNPNDSIIPLYYEKLLLFAGLPIILGFIAFAFWYISSAIKRDYSELKSKFTSTLVVLLFLVHPNIANNMFLSFNCLQVDTDFRLKLNLESICYQGQHQFFILVIVFPSIVLWSIGIPVFSCFLLIKNRRIIDLMNRKELTQAEFDEVLNLKIKYGFLFQGYNANTFYWESVLMFRKIGIIMATVFLSMLSPEM